MVDPVPGLIEKLHHQNTIVCQMLGALNIYEAHPAADKKIFRLMRIRYSMLLEENELLIQELARNGLNDDIINSYLRVPRMFLPAPGDPIDDGDSWKRPN